MLERFKVPVKDQVFVAEAALRRTVTEIFEKMGLTPEDAAEGADVLTMTDLRGVETHGVSNMLRAYVRDYKAGKLDPRPGWRMMREAPGTAVIDAERRLGIIVGPEGDAAGHGQGAAGRRRHRHRVQRRPLRRHRPLRHAGGRRPTWWAPASPPPGSTWCPPSRRSRCSAPIPSRWPRPRAARRRCSSTPPPRPSRATRSGWPCGWARRSCRAGSPTRTARRSWRRSPSSTATTSSRPPWAARASRARTRATASR